MLVTHSINFIQWFRFKVFKTLVMSFKGSSCKQSRAAYFMEENAMSVVTTLLLGHGLLWPRFGHRLLASAFTVVLSETSNSFISEILVLFAVSNKFSLSMVNVSNYPILDQSHSFFLYQI